ncbi:MAG TPA: surface-adhesin E family protein [Telluria sp.]|nr:surface-adhesin E family protein [Telluria sp.]
MRKLILLLLSAPLLANAAQWAKVGSLAGADSYIDKASTIKTDKGYKVWSLVSYAAPQATPDGTSYLSAKALHLYACAERTTTLLTKVYYGEAMGKGAVAESFKYEKFDPEDIVPDSVEDDALQVICRGKKP